MGLYIRIFLCCFAINLERGAETASAISHIRSQRLSAASHQT